MHLADKAGPDQPVHKRRLIRTFVVRKRNQLILLYISTNKKLPDWTSHAHADLDLRCPQNA